MTAPRMKPGDVFGWMTVTELIPSSKDHKSPRVKGICCHCKNEVTKSRNAIYSMTTLSCGCRWHENQFKHGCAVDGKWSPEYQSWVHMKDRCLNPNHKQYYGYGGRGITVCERWLNFANFLADMGQKQISEELDRIDNDKGYGPDNCQWLSKENNLAKRDMHRRYKSNPIPAKLPEVKP